MERIVNTRPEPVVSPVSWAWEDHRGPDDGNDDPGIEVDRDLPAPYRTQPSRPGTQLIARVALWAAVALGCVGGCVGLARPSADPAPAAAPATISADVPAPVAGTAERVVSAWLSATNEEQVDIGALFVGDVHLTPRGLDPLIVESVTTVAGREISAGYWSVTVAADVRETPDPVDETAVDGADGGVSSPPTTEDADGVTTWYVEVGIVGDVETGLAALTTPGVLPAAPRAPEGWRREDAGLTLAQEDEQWATVDGFLRALLTGEGDPARYMAPGRSIATATQPPFVAVEVQVMTMAGNPEDGRVEIWVEADVETPGGVRRLVAYAIDMAERQDRWEVVAVSGVPTRVLGESAEQAPDTTVEPDPSSTTTEAGSRGTAQSGDGDGPAGDEAPADIDGADPDDESPPTTPSSTP